MYISWQYFIEKKKDCPASWIGIVMENSLRNLLWSRGYGDIERRKRKFYERDRCLSNIDDRFLTLNDDIEFQTTNFKLSHFFCFLFIFI